MKITPFSLGQLLVFVPFLLVQCSKSGTSTKNTTKPNDSNQTSVEKPGYPMTETPIKSENQFELSNLACLVPKEAKLPSFGSENKIIDGDPLDWQETSAQILDPMNEGSLIGNYKEVKIHITENYFQILIEMSSIKDNTSEVRHLLNFGELFIDSTRSINNLSKNIFMVKENSLFQKINDDWQPITSSSTKLVGSKEAFLEVQIPRILLDRTLASPAWWIKLASFHEIGFETNPPLDQTIKRFFNSIKDTDRPNFYIEGCQLSHSSDLPTIWSIRNFSERDIPYKYLFKTIKTSVDTIFGSSAFKGKKYGSSFNFIITKNIVRDILFEDEKITDHFTVNLINKTPTINEEKKNIYIEITKNLIHKYLYQSHPDMSKWPLKGFFETSLSNSFLCKKLGFKFLLHSIRDTSQNRLNKFSNLYLTSFHTEPLFNFLISLENNFDLLLTSEDSLKEFLNKEKAISEEGEICGFFPLISGVYLNEIWNGWMDENPYSQKFDQNSFTDDDQDLLPKFIENHLNLDSFSFDTDKDGFKDTSEIVFKSSPTDDDSYPNYIVMDGEFSDWHKLIGSKVIIDNEKELSQCANAYDILFTGAVFDENKIHLGVEHKPLSEGFPYYIETLLEFPTLPDKYLIILSYDRKGYRIKNLSNDTMVIDYPYGSICKTRACELTINLSSIGIELNTIDDKTAPSISIKGFKLESHPKLCDQTEPFKPLLKK